MWDHCLSSQGVFGLWKRPGIFWNGNKRPGIFFQLFPLFWMKNSLILWLQGFSCYLSKCRHISRFLCMMFWFCYRRGSSLWRFRFPFDCIIIKTNKVSLRIASDLVYNDRKWYINIGGYFIIEGVLSKYLSLPYFLANPQLNSSVAGLNQH